MTEHWGLPDPAAVKGNDAEKALAIAQTFAALTLKAHLTEIGRRQ